MIPFLLCLSFNTSRTRYQTQNSLFRYAHSIQTIPPRRTSPYPQDARNNPDRAYQQAVKNSKLPALIAVATKKTSAFGADSGSEFPSTSSAFGNNSTTTTPSAFWKHHDSIRNHLHTLIRVRETTGLWPTCVRSNFYPYPSNRCIWSATQQ